MIAFLIVAILIVVSTLIILNLPVFGQKPKGKRLESIKSLPLYLNGALQNQSVTPTLPAGVSYLDIINRMVKGNPNGSPQKALPHLRSDFTVSEQLKITWFGHSSYLIQVDGLNILVDPVFCERLSPFQFMGTKQFKGTDFLEVENLPALDIVLITHDHYDHLDYHAILKLKDKASRFVTSLGVGAHLEHWGVAPEKIIELSWNEQSAPFPTIKFIALPARHFSGRKFKRNQSLWSSFVLKTAQHQLYLGGDSGYDSHFKAIGAKYGPFDLAILECGQYDEMWPLIHMSPEEVVTATMDLKASKLMPVHWGKYKLALHDWDEPIKRVSKAAKDQDVFLITPRLGETFIFENNSPNTAWWLNI
jgi:L-ascorbate metabolism protein UlaG (beta-lactamase superfamily)